VIQGLFYVFVTKQANNNFNRHVKSNTKLTKGFAFCLAIFEPSSYLAPRDTVVGNWERKRQRGSVKPKFHHADFHQNFPAGKVVDTNHEIRGHKR